MMALFASFFFHWGNGSPHTPHLSLSPKGVREMATVHSEMTGRRVGGGGRWDAVPSQYPVTGLSIIFRRHRIQHYRETNGRFPLLLGEVPKGVFVIFRLERDKIIYLNI